MMRVLGGWWRSGEVAPIEALWRVAMGLAVDDMNWDYLYPERWIRQRKVGDLVWVCSGRGCRRGRRWRGSVYRTPLTFLGIASKISGPFTIDRRRRGCSINKVPSGPHPAQKVPPHSLARPTATTGHPEPRRGRVSSPNIAAGLPSESWVPLNVGGGGQGAAGIFVGGALRKGTLAHAPPVQTRSTSPYNCGGKVHDRSRRNALACFLPSLTSTSSSYPFHRSPCFAVLLASSSSPSAYCSLPPSLPTILYRSL
jgi:hypothetical protein